LIEEKLVELYESDRVGNDRENCVHLIEDWSEFFSKLGEAGREKRAQEYIYAD
jgi:hypothetical protein